MTFAIVLGMHRSGTSVLTAGLGALGLDLGGFDDIRDDNNPRGYGEHPRVRHFNDRLLAHLGVTWDNWGFHAATAGLEGPALAPWRAEAAALLTELFADRPHAALKDPRITMLLPFWRAVLADLGWPVHWIMILRHPDEVAESQIRRLARAGDPTPPDSAGMAMQALWAVTMHAALSQLPEPGVLLLRHDQLLSEPAATLTAVARWLDLPDATRATGPAAEIVDPALYRSQPSGAAAGGDWGVFRRAILTP